MDSVTRYYISTTGTVHLTVGDGDQGQVLVCSDRPGKMGRPKNNRWGGHPSKLDLDIQKTVDALAGNLNKKLPKREPRMVCGQCFPPDPTIVGVV